MHVMMDTADPTLRVNPTSSNSLVLPAAKGPQAKLCKTHALLLLCCDGNAAAAASGPLIAVQDYQHVIRADAPSGVLGGMSAVDDWRRSWPIQRTLEAPVHIVSLEPDTGLPCFLVIPH